VDKRVTAHQPRQVGCAVFTSAYGLVRDILKRMILIKDSTVVDGTGKPGERADILIKDDRISAIGKLGSQKTATVIEGRGLISVPGFIDVNTDSDHYLSLFTDRGQHDFLLQGVTTIFGGHCGSSLAPLLRGSLQSIRKWGDTGAVNVDWQLMDEFLATLDRLKIGVNFGTLVGHSTIRRALLGEDARDLTARDMEAFESLLKQALDHGGFGLSTGLAYNHSRHTPYLEIKALTDVVASRRGVYTTHLRSEAEHLLESVQETISIAKESKLPTIISHFRAIKGSEAQFEESVELIEAAAAEGVPIWFDAYPFDYSMLPVYMMLPDSIRVGSLEHMLAALSTSHGEGIVYESLPRLRVADLVIARAPGFDYLVGKTIGHFAESNELNLKQALLKLMKLTRLRAVLFYKNINFDITSKALLSERALVASNSPSLVEGRNVIENERAKNTFSRFLEIAAAQKKTIEWSVKKLTAVPAGVFNIPHRGLLKEGAIADIALLSSPVASSSRAYTGATHVLVGGKQVVADGAFADVYNGKILRRT